MQRSGVILAGGNSRRMGQDKRFMKLAGKSLLAWAVEQLRPWVDELIVVTADPAVPLEDLGTRVAHDQYPGAGALAGIHAGLLAARGTWAFVMACDMPFLNIQLLDGLWQIAQTAPVDVVIPHRRQGLEPLHALYRPATCLPAIEAALNQQRRRLISFYDAVKVRQVTSEELAAWDPEGLSFCNVNTLQDFEEVRRRLKLR
ncbi:MAG: molybdenum cofactor guanylyltransferase [Chloroflexota bacterium]|nr:molybdenum cofactor guanylyltransferase [Chloroflexota bacterium]